nr:serine/threonine-protein phosphatase 7 long form homolog [Ipomoea batatas]
MDRVNNPYATDAHRVSYHTHGRLFIGNPEHQQDQGYVQCGASLNDAMHLLRDLHISSGEVPVDGAQAIQRLQEIHVSTREHIVRAGYAEANQHRHDADDDDGGFEDVNALAIVLVPYRADEQNCEP